MERKDYFTELGGGAVNAALFNAIYDFAAIHAAWVVYGAAAADPGDGMHTSITDTDTLADLAERDDSSFSCAHNWAARALIDRITASANEILNAAMHGVPVKLE